MKLRKTIKGIEILASKEICDPSSDGAKHAIAQLATVNSNLKREIADLKKKNISKGFEIKAQAEKYVKMKKKLLFGVEIGLETPRKDEDTSF